MFFPLFSDIYRGINSRKEKYRIFSISKQSGNEATYLTEYIADTETDVLDLHHIEKCLAGSTCFIIVTSAVYMLGNDDIRHEI